MGRMREMYDSSPEEANRRGNGEHELDGDSGIEDEEGRREAERRQTKLIGAEAANDESRGKEEADEADEMLNGPQEYLAQYGTAEMRTVRRNETTETRRNPRDVRENMKERSDSRQVTMTKRGDEQEKTDVNDEGRHRMKKTAEKRYERRVVEIQTGTSSESEDEDQQDAGKLGIETKGRVSRLTVERAYRRKIEWIAIGDETEESEDEEITTVWSDAELTGGATGGGEKGKINRTSDWRRRQGRH